jgi:hypothetical protein
MPSTCAHAVCEVELLTACVTLLHLTHTRVLATSANTQGATEATPAPKWLSPLLLLLDVWERTLTISKWTRPANKVGGQAVE